MGELIKNREVKEALSRVISIRHSKNIVELDMVDEVTIEGNNVHVKLRPPEDCLCPYPFFLATLAEKKLRELEGINEVKVDVILQ